MGKSAYSVEIKNNTDNKFDINVNMVLDSLF